jgi:hypothetical protein
MSDSILPGEPEAFSLFGRPLYRPPLRPETLDQQTRLYRDALRSWEAARGQGALGLVTTGYGVANWYSYNGLKEKAAGVLREMLSLEGWTGFGYIAAEADLKRMGLRP